MRAGTPSTAVELLAPMFGLRRSGTARAAGRAVLTGLGMRDFRDRFHLTDPRVVTQAAD